MCVFLSCFGFEDGIWDLAVLVSHHCLSFYSFYFVIWFVLLFTVCWLVCYIKCDRISSSSLLCCITLHVNF